MEEKQEKTTQKLRQEIHVYCKESGKSTNTQNFPSTVDWEIFVVKIFSTVCVSDES